MIDWLIDWLGTSSRLCFWNRFLAFWRIPFIVSCENVVGKVDAPTISDKISWVFERGRPQLGKKHLNVTFSACTPPTSPFSVGNGKRKNWRKENNIVRTEGRGLDGKILGEEFVRDSLKGQGVATLLALIVVLNFNFTLLGRTQKASPI